jgi:hypothetical protein
LAQANKKMCGFSFGDSESLHFMSAIKDTNNKMITVARIQAEGN